MPQFSIPLSGLNASSQALSVISNNLANLNTDGYKDQESSFADVFYQTIGTAGSGNLLQIGNGTSVNAITTNFNDGSPTSTGVTTDMAISGDGFFITQDSTGQTLYTRSGNFTKNNIGQLTTQDGSLVMGYMANNGVITPGGTALGPIQVAGITNPASETQNIQVTSNLDAGATADASSVLNAPVTIYDSLGVTHNLNIAFTKTAANTWSYAVTIPAADITAGSTTLASGTMGFNSSGVLTTITPTAGVPAPAANLTFNVTNLADKAADMTGGTAITWNLFDSSNNPVITQLASPSTTSGTSQDGYTSGTLQSFTVDSTGVIQGTFSNNRTASVGQVALAMFGNPQGLQRAGDNSFQATLPSGPAVVGAPGSGGRGSITGGALELSNVDVATEFSNLIIAQRGYEANAKVVTTMNTITQDTINLIQG